MATEHTQPGLPAPTSIEERQVAVSVKLTGLLEWLPTVRALTRASQRQLGFQTPEVQHAIAHAQANEHEEAILDYEIRPGRQWERPEARLVGGGHTRTPAATFGALNLLQEISWTLHRIVATIVRALGQQGVCAIAVLPTEPTDEQLIAHIRELAWAAPSPKLLQLIDEGLTWLNDQADRLVNGDAKATLPDHCPYCDNPTLVVYFRDDVIICGRNTKTRHLDPCICNDPICACKQDPVGFRHEWIRRPDNDTKTRNTWRRLNSQLTFRRSAAPKETK